MGWIGIQIQIQMPNIMDMSRFLFHDVFPGRDLVKILLLSVQPLK